MNPSPAHDIGTSAPWLERMEETLRMDRVWQWAWDRHGARYSWAALMVVYAITLPMWVLPALVVIEFEESDRFLATAAVAATILLASVYNLVRPGFKEWRLMERWAAGDQVDRLEVLESTYSWGRSTFVRGVAVYTLTGGMGGLVVGALTGANASRLIQYGILGSTFLAAVQLLAITRSRRRPCVLSGSRSPPYRGSGTHCLGLGRVSRRGRTCRPSPLSGASPPRARCWPP